MARLFVVVEKSPAAPELVRSDAQMTFPLVSVRRSCPLAQLKPESWRALIVAMPETLNAVVLA
jgi:hypothetical protein